MELNQAYTLHWLSDVEMPLANKFYRQHGFRGKAKRHEHCAVIKDPKAGIIACAYLRDYDTFRLLAGVAVASDYQGQGVASHLVAMMIERFDQHTYTFPYQYLQAWYASLGFVDVGAEPLAPEVERLLHTYRDQGRAISAMRWQPA